MNDYPDYTSLMQIIGSDVMVPIDIQGAYIMMPVDIQAQIANLEIDIVAQTMGNIAIDIKAQTMSNLNINIAAQAADINVNITNATISVVGTVVIVGTPTVVISGEVDVNITNATISVVGTVAISGTPTVTISGTPTVAISGEVDVNITNATIAVTGTVAISGTVTVSISGTPTVAISGTVTVSISGTANIDIKTQSVGVYLQPDWAVLTGVQKQFHLEGLDKDFHTWNAIIYDVPGDKTLYITWVTAQGIASNASDADLPQMVTLDIYNHTDEVHLAEIGGNGGLGLSFPTPLKVLGGKRVYFYIYAEGNHEMNIYGDIGGYEI